MIKHIVYKTAGAAMAVLLLASLTAAIPPQSRVRVQQNGYTLDGDSVRVTMAIMPGGAQLPSRSQITLIPTLRSGSVSMGLPMIQINGRNKAKVHRRAVALHRSDPNVRTVIDVTDKGAPEIYLYNAAVAYEPWMSGAEFMLCEEQCRCNGSVVPMSFELLVKQMMSLPAMPQPVAAPRFAVSYVIPEAEAVKRRSESGKAFLDFATGRSAIDPAYKNNPAELKKIYDLIGSVKNDPDATITGISITGHSSPDGTYASNLSLSQKRAAALRDNLRAMCGLRESMFTVKGSGEDWATLDSLVSRSNMAYKDQVLSIIRGTDIFDGREKKLMNLSGGVPYREMKAGMFPQLRRSDYQLDYTVLPFTVEKGKEVFKTHPSLLSLNEMFLIAQTYDKGSPEFNELFETAVRLFPGSEVANLNAAAIALDENNLKGARVYLKKVSATGNASTTAIGAAGFNNRGILFFMDGDRDKALDCFARAQALGCAEAAANLQSLTAFEQATAEYQRQIKEYRRYNRQE